MSIVYTIIAKEKDIILCDYSEYEGNFQNISLNLLKKTQDEARATFSYNNEYYFHYFNTLGITYMCMADGNISKETAYTYLEDIKTSLYSTFPQKDIEKARAYSLEARFREKIKGRMVILF
jgi:hypothetical protein